MMILASHYGPVDGERGASAVEFTLVLPFLLLILFAVFEYAWVGVSQITLNHVVVQGAMAATKARESVGESPDEFARVFIRQSGWPQPIEDTAIHVVVHPASGNLPRRIEVSVINLPYRPLTAMLPNACMPEHLNAKSVVPLP